MNGKELSKLWDHVSSINERMARVETNWNWIRWFVGLNLVVWLGIMAKLMNAGII